MENPRALGRGVGEWLYDRPSHLQMALAALGGRELPTGEAFK